MVLMSFYIYNLTILVLTIMVREELYSPQGIPGIA